MPSRPHAPPQRRPGASRERTSAPPAAAPAKRAGAAGGGSPPSLDPELVEVKALMEEQLDNIRAMAMADKKGTSVFFIARGDHIGMFVVRINETPRERLYLCKIVEVIDDLRVPK